MSETRDDVVAELDRWLTDMREYGTDKGTDYQTIQRARDEIVALRDTTIGDIRRQLRPQIRAEALEEAARLFDQVRKDYVITAAYMAEVIRQLKDRQCETS